MKLTKRQKEVLDLIAEGWTLRAYPPKQFKICPPKRRYALQWETVTARTVQPLIDAGRVQVHS